MSDESGTSRVKCEILLSLYALLPASADVDDDVRQVKKRSRRGEEVTAGIIYNSDPGSLFPTLLLLLALDSYQILVPSLKASLPPSSASGIS